LLIPFCGFSALRCSARSCRVPRPFGCSTCGLHVSRRARARRAHTRRAPRRCWSCGPLGQGTELRSARATFLNARKAGWARQGGRTQGRHTLHLHAGHAFWPMSAPEDTEGVLCSSSRTDACPLRTRGGNTRIRPLWPGRAKRCSQKGSLPHLTLRRLSSASFAICCACCSASCAATTRALRSSSQPRASAAADCQHSRSSSSMAFIHESRSWIERGTYIAIRPAGASG